MKQKTWKRTKLKMEQEQVVRRNKFALKKGQNSNISALMQCEKKG